MQPFFALGFERGLLVNKALCATNFVILSKVSGANFIYIVSRIAIMKRGLLVFLLLIVSVNADCSDSDDGKDFYEKGAVDSDQYFGGLCEDKCVGNTLEEKLCTAYDKCGLETYLCPYGCEDGRCIEKTETDCYDTDGGKNLFLRGEVHGEADPRYNNDSIGRDDCIDYWNLVEYFCGPEDKIMKYTTRCEWGCRKRHGMCYEENCKWRSVVFENITNDNGKLRVLYMTESNPGEVNITVDGKICKIVRQSCINEREWDIHKPTKIHCNAITECDYPNDHVLLEIRDTKCVKEDDELELNVPVEVVEDSADDLIEDTVEAKPVQPTTITVTAEVAEPPCAGCEIDDECLQIWQRYWDSYCAPDKTIQKQKSVGESCQTNPECINKRCLNDRCWELSKFRKFICRTREFFGGSYIGCITSFK